MFCRPFVVSESRRSMSSVWRFCGFLQRSYPIFSRHSLWAFRLGHFFEHLRKAWTWMFAFSKWQWTCNQTTPNFYLFSCWSCNAAAACCVVVAVDCQQSDCVLFLAFSWFYFAVVVVVRFWNMWTMCCGSKVKKKTSLKMNILLLAIFLYFKLNEQTDMGQL